MNTMKTGLALAGLVLVMMSTAVLSFLAVGTMACESGGAATGGNTPPVKDTGSPCTMACGTDDGTTDGSTDAPADVAPDVAPADTTPGDNPVADPGEQKPVDLGLFHGKLTSQGETFPEEIAYEADFHVFHFELANQFKWNPGDGPEDEWVCSGELVDGYADLLCPDIANHDYKGFISVKDGKLEVTTTFYYPDMDENVINRFSAVRQQ